MMASWLSFFFGCAHRHLSRPMTPISQPGSSAATYVVCLDCGKHFAYDWKEMRIGPLVESGQADAEGRAWAERERARV